ncbi:hypothetical protein [Streptomyces ipomoeae]|nr:hypothetical protein [Streptomyces ipomoeae]MDX2936414.1 hypothetical protein [Streptomyces ipomoeae]
MAMASNDVTATCTSPTALLASISRAFEQAQDAMLRANPRYRPV